MTIVRKQPADELNLFVKEIYYCNFSNEKRIPVIDDCCHDLVIFKEADAIIYSAEFMRGSPVSEPIFSLFNINPPFSIEISSSLSFITVKFQPWCNDLIFGSRKKVGVHDLSTDFMELVKTDEVMDLFVTNNPIQEIESKLPYFLERFKMQAKHKLLQAIITYIYENRGQLKVSDLVSHFQLSRQYLNTLFKKYIHYSIKHFISMVRVIEAVKFQLNNPGIQLTTLAYEVGYYDQAHFVKDFNRITGSSPKKFFNQNGAFFQRHRL